MLPKEHISNRITGFILLIIGLGVIAYMKWTHHELWKDEWQAWFVSSDMSIGQIFSFLNYEGHPALWYLYLKIWSPFSVFIGAENTIQLAHLFTVAGGLYILCLRFQMHWILKILFMSSYFMTFEYGVINRGYFLVILFTFWAIDLMTRESHTKPWALGLVLFFLCQTEIYGVLIAISLGFLHIFQSRQTSSFLTDRTIRGLLIGLVVFVISVFPRTVGHIGKTQGKSWPLSQKLGIAFQGNLSNTYLTGSTFDTAQYGATFVGLILSVFVLVGMGLIFRYRKDLAYAMGLFLLMMMGFCVLFFVGGIRQWGLGFVLFIGLVEMCGFKELKKNLIPIFIVSLFAGFSMIHGIKAIKSEIEIPFTNAKEAGEFIKTKVPEKVPILAINKFAATPVIGYAGRKFYELPTGEAFSYFRWVEKIYLPTESELKLFAKFKGVGGIVLISPNLLDQERFPSIKLWQQFTSENYKGENFYIYTLTL